MATSEIKYLGDLRTEAVHLQSGEKIITDAPTDNQGKGEAFSPTDLLATSLGNCMLTTIGIRAKEYAVDIEGATCEVTKVMAANPRRVAEIHVRLSFPPNNYTEEQKQFLEKTANTCPVIYSLHPDIVKKVEFNY